MKYEEREKERGVSIVDCFIGVVMMSVPGERLWGEKGGREGEVVVFYVTKRLFYVQR